MLQSADIEARPTETPLSEGCLFTASALITNMQTPCAVLANMIMCWKHQSSSYTSRIAVCYAASVSWVGRERSNRIHSE